MGRDKGLVPLAGKPLIEHVLSKLTGLSEEILITTNAPEQYAYLDVHTVRDRVPGAGALAGLYSALAAAKGDHILVVACDMPFVNRRLLEHLCRLAPNGDVVVPYYNQKYEPFLAVYARSVLPEVEAALSTGQRRMISFYPKVKIHTVEAETLDQFDPERLSFFNINTPEDLAHAEEILRSNQ